MADLHCNKTITVGELKNYLENIDDNTIISGEAHPRHGSVICFNVKDIRKVGKRLVLYGFGKTWH